jgi:hypothetical protein
MFLHFARKNKGIFPKRSRTWLVDANQKSQVVKKVVKKLASKTKLTKMKTTAEKKAK